MNKWIRRKRNSWGYGVQSPSDFYFVQHVLRERSPYYGYETLKELKRQYATSLSSYSAITDQLLFRLANFAHSDLVLEIGAGLSAFAMAIGHPFARHITITASSTRSKDLQPLTATYPQVEIRDGDEIRTLQQILQEHGSIGTLHIAHTDRYKEAVSTSLPYITDRSLIIIEDIRANKEKSEWWKGLQEDPRTGISYDLGSIGLLFFDRSRHKNTYWINLLKKV
jgi:predicted O-methyltransferase YrrM